jgi:putative YhbY family RNA-binding protein
MHVVVQPRFVDFFTFGFDFHECAFQRDNSDMTALTLTTSEIRDLRAQAHHLDPVVAVGSDGLTPAVLREIDSALNAHGLIKVRAHADDREQRQAWLSQIADAHGAAVVQHIGKLLVFWRPIPEKEKTVDEDRRPGPKVVKMVRNSSRGGQRPEVRHVKVLGNQRLTASGKVKRSKPKQKSVKKRSLG